MSAASSSQILGSSVGDLSRTCRPCERKLDARDDVVRNDRTDAAEPKREDVGDNGVALLLAMLVTVAVESRFEYLDAADASDILESRRDRSAEMNIMVSCSDIGEGPGTGGSGLDGGSDNGGLGLGRGLDRTADRGVPSGVLGMNDGGAGKDDSRRGRALRLSARRDSVVVVADMAEGQEQRQSLKNL
jgi:hypothetical protein